jgi:hypothetical protein
MPKLKPGFVPIEFLYFGFLLAAHIERLRRGDIPGNVLADLPMEFNMGTCFCGFSSGRRGCTHPINHSKDTSFTANVQTAITSQHVLFIIGQNCRCIFPGKQIEDVNTRSGYCREIVRIRLSGSIFVIQLSIFCDTTEYGKFVLIKAKTFSFRP